MEIGLFLACIKVASFAAATCIVHHAAFSAVTLKTTAQDPLQREDRDPNKTDNAEMQRNAWILTLNLRFHTLLVLDQREKQNWD